MKNAYMQKLADKISWLFEIKLDFHHLGMSTTSRRLKVNIRKILRVLQNNFFLFILYTNEIMDIL